MNNTFSLYKNSVNSSDSGPSGKKVSANNVISHHINPYTTDFSLGISLLYILGHFQEMTKRKIASSGEAQKVRNCIINLWLPHGILVDPQEIKCKVKKKKSDMVSYLQDKG